MCRNKLFAPDAVQKSTRCQCQKHSYRGGRSVGMSQPVSVYRAMEALRHSPPPHTVYMLVSGVYVTLCAGVHCCSVEQSVRSIDDRISGETDHL